MRARTLAHHLAIIVGTVLALVAQLCAAEEKPPRVCVYGHETLDRVKIVERGCMRSPDDPEAYWHCSTCGFNGRAGTEWNRDAEDSATFVQPFSSLVQEFPIPEASRRTETKFSQAVRDGIVRSERLYFVTSEPLRDLQEAVARWAERHAILLTPPQVDPDPVPRPLYPGGPRLNEQIQSWGYEKGEPLTGHVMFINDPDANAVRVDVLITMSRSEVGTIDEARRRQKLQSQAPAP